MKIIMPIPNNRRFTDEQRRDAIQDYTYPRRSKSTAEANHDRFLERKQTSEVYYDPYTGQASKRVIPLTEVYPEFDFLLAGKAAVDAFARPGIVLRKERYGKGKLSVGPKTGASVKKTSDVLKTKLVTDKVKDKAKEKAEEAAFGKSKQDVIREAYEDMINNLGKNSHKSGIIKTESDVDREIDNFLDYLDSKEVRQRVSDIGNRFGTNYKGAIDYTNKNIRNNTDFADKIDDKFAQYNPFDDIVTIGKDAPYSSVGHEWKHKMDYLSSNNFTKYGPRNKRLIDLGTNSKGGPNIRLRQEVIRDLINDGYSESDAMQLYEYMLRPTEISSHLSDVIYGYNMKHGTNTVPRFTRESFEDILFNNPMKNSSNNFRLFYNYMVKDKDEFINKINKSAFSTIGIGTLINNHEKD